MKDSQNPDVETFPGIIPGTETQQMLGSNWLAL